MNNASTLSRAALETELSAHTIAQALWTAEREGISIPEIAKRHDWNAQSLSRRSREPAVQALLDAERTWHGAALRKALVSDAIEGAREAILCLRAEARRPGASGVQACRTLLEVVRVIGPQAIVNLTLDQSQHVHLDDLPTPEFLRAWRESIDEAERALTNGALSRDTALVAPSKENPSDGNQAA